MTKNIILIGYRCTGKTSLAHSLAERLHLRAVDSDVLIEERAGKTIAAIFVEDGEEAFRDLEEIIIAEILTETLDKTAPLILATGGGAILRESTRWRLREKGTVFWLKASPEVLFDRMATDPLTQQRRPNLTTLSPLEEIQKILLERELFYRETAHHELDTGEQSIAELADMIQETAAQERRI